MFVELLGGAAVDDAADDDDVPVVLPVDVVVGEGSPYCALTRTGRNRAARARENFMVAERNRGQELLG